MGNGASIDSEMNDVNILDAPASVQLQRKAKGKKSKTDDESRSGSSFPAQEEQLVVLEHRNIIKSGQIESHKDDNNSTVPMTPTSTKVNSDSNKENRVEKKEKVRYPSSESEEELDVRYSIDNILKKKGEDNGMKIKEPASQKSKNNSDEFDYERPRNNFNENSNRINNIISSSTYSDFDKEDMEIGVDVGSSKTSESNVRFSSERDQIYGFDDELPQSAPLSDSNSDKIVKNNFSGKSSAGIEEMGPEEEDLGPLQILLQFIPYYGQGDPSNDSIVRAALSNLSIEDIDTKDEYGNTLLLLACQYRCEDLVRIMLNKGADPNAINSSGACGLHFACYKETMSKSIAKALLQNGGNPEIREYTYGCTPLHYCAGTGDIDFCKLLLSFGAQVNTLDYYNYTCVDYAREAGADTIASYLQQRLDKLNSQSMIRNGYSMMTPTGAYSHGFDSPGLPKASSFFNSDQMEWQQYNDPATGMNYYVHNKTGECLWESDWKARMQQQNRSNPSQPQPPPVLPTSSKKADKPGESSSSKSSSSSNSTANNSSSSSSKKAEEPQYDPKLISQTIRVKLIAFLGKVDPTRLLEVETLIENCKGRELEFYKSLCKQYNVPEEKEYVDMLSKISLATQKSNPQGQSSQALPSSGITNAVPTTNGSSITGTGSRPGTSCGMATPFGKSNPLTISTEFEIGKTPPIGARGTSMIMGNVNPAPIVMGIDPAAVQEAVNECRTKYESQIEQERVTYRTAISEKDGIISKLQSQIESLSREKLDLQTEIAEMSQKLELSRLQGGEAQHKLESSIDNLHSMNRNLKDELENTKSELNAEREKLKSLEDSLAKLTLGHEETIAREREEAEQRVKLQREREAQHQAELKKLEEQMTLIDQNNKADMAKANSEWKQQKNELKSQFEAMKRAKEKEIDALNKELAERKARFAQELSAAQMERDDHRKVAEEAINRAENAEAVQRSMQEEIVEARSIQQFNAQLHKDLLREQLARKRLHNEMEDLKGRIRVYVRIRPMSSSEFERGCSEAVIKDGKLSCLVRGVGGPDGKKIYDFDQVFGGSEGNNQSDIFRDTKHLMMSVIDGYNVCIFAYGQTGAGKSYTMIGSADIGSCLLENGEFEESAGITPRAVSELFRLLNERTAQMTFEVEVQMFQLYRDSLEDLLAEKKKKKKDEDEKKEPPLKITLAEHSSTGLVRVEGAESMMALSPLDVMKIFAKGSARRTTASTQMNAESSRSHLICCLVVKMVNRRSGQESLGKLTLVDLAGSERLDKSGATGENLKEAQSINKSLSALGDVISALTTGQQHIPYRNHPLTMLMSDSIGGNAKTLMFVNTSPADYNVSESNNSLSFASRCKDITNSVSTNAPAAQQAQMNALKKELARLKKGGTNPSSKSSAGLARPV